VGGELETRRNDRIFLFNLLKAKSNDDWDEVISILEAGMEQDDVKIVMQKFEEWKKLKEGR
jgi:hypothetical protein